MQKGDSVGIRPAGGSDMLFFMVCDPKVRNVNKCPIKRLELCFNDIPPSDHKTTRMRFKSFLLATLKTQRQNLSALPLP
jgi:hypothetical protein